MNQNNQFNSSNDLFISEIQQIIQQEIEILRQLISNCYDDKSEENTIQLNKKLKKIRKQKEDFFENFFFLNASNCELSILKDHLASIKEEFEKKQIMAKKINKNFHCDLKPLTKKEVKIKTIVSTIDQQEF